MNVFRGRVSHLAVPFVTATVSILLACFAFVTTQTVSAVPTTMNFQGRLADTSGNIMPDGLYNMQFRLFTVSTGGTATWTETRETTDRVQVTNGLFSTQLGAVTPITASLFSGNDVYFEITMPTPGTATCSTASCASWESPMTPRQKMATSAYAFQAENANTLDGLDSTAFAASTGSANYIQNTTSPQTADFSITGTGTAGILQAATLDTASAGTLTIGGTNATAITLSDNTTVNANLTVSAGNSLTLTGGNTASRPGSPSEGMVYFDSQTDQLLTYANGKWQADRTDAVLVAASNSSQNDKDVADFVADGNTGTAADGDQVQINAALTAGSGKKVVLLAGTYTVDASVSVPNNTTLTGVGNGTLVEFADIDDTDELIVNTDTTTGTGVTIRDMKLDGRNDLNTVGIQTGIYMNKMGDDSGGSARTGATITGVYATNFTWYAIQLYQTGYNTLTNNTAKDNDFDGFNLVFTRYSSLSGNVAATNGADGFGVASSSDNTLTGNNALDNVGHGFNLSAGGNTLTSNTATGNDNGFNIDVGSDNIITDNKVGWSYGHGIRLSNAQRNKLSSNQIGAGIYIEDNSHENTLQDNTIVGNGDFVPLYIASSDSNIITNNIITAEYDDNYAIEIADVGAENNYLSGNYFSSDEGDTVINDLGTGTVYTGQSMNEGGLDTVFKQASSSAFQIQNAAGDSLLNANTTDMRLSIGSAVGTDARVYIEGELQGDDFTWTPRAEAEANGWESVTYGNGLYVAVATNGTNQVMTSPDGTTWTPRAAAEANSWRSVTYGNGLFVAVSGSGTNRVMTSPDGTTWTPRAAAEANNWQSVTYGNGLFVAVASSGTNRVMTSPDGTTWTPQSVASDGWIDVTYGNGLFVAVSYGTTVMTSPDGVTWTPQTPAVANDWQSVTYGSGLFVAVSSTGTDRVMTSPDGVTWTSRVTPQAQKLWDVTYGDGVFVAVAAYNEAWDTCTNNCVMTSPDGVTWTSGAAAEANQWESVTYGNGLFVAVSPDGTNQVMTSTGYGSQAVEVAGRTTINGFMQINDDLHVAGQASLVGGAYITGQTTIEANSSQAFMIQNNAGNLLFAADTVNGGIGIGTAASSTAKLTIVGSGAWTASAPAEANQWRGVGYGNGLYVAVATNGTNQVMTSPDGTTWTPRAEAEANQWYSVTYGNGLFVAVASSGTNRVMTSPDGTTWTPRAATEPNGWNSVTYGNGLFVAVSDWGTNRVMTSPDGTTWTPRTATEDTYWQSVTYGNGLFVAVASSDTNRIMTSTDGTTWVAQSVPTSSQREAITYGNGRFVSVPYGGDSDDVITMNMGTAVSVSGNTSLQGNTLVKADSTTAFQIQNASGTSVFNVDTTDNNITLGAATSLTLTGGNTASRPGSPVEGMVYFDSETDQLLTYANGKWQADRSDAVLVAANNSSNADKAAADYVADGNTGTAADGDQVQINSALTAASGKKVVLLAGTYTVDASVSVPNNTTLTGIGNGTLLTIPNSFNANLNVITNTDAATGTGVVIRDLVVDGNKANQASGDQIGVYLDDMGTLSTGVVGATIRDIVAKNLTRGGVNLFSSELTTISNITVLSIDSYAIDISGNSSNANKIVGNTVKDSNYGIFLGWGENNVVTNNILDSNDYGIYSSAYRSTISNNTFRSNERAIFLEAATHNVVEGNVIYNSTLDGIYITSASNNIINENILQDNGGATANNAIYLTASDNNTITDNSITDSSASTTNYPININNSSSDNNYLSGNKFTSTPGTSTIRDIGTGTRFASQSVAEGGLNMLYKQTASATAFQVQNASAAALFTADSTNNRLEVGSSTTDSTAIFFTLDKYNNGTDPAGVDGAMYYNTSLNKFRCYQNAAWTDCVLTPGSISQSLLASASNSIDIGSSGTTWRSGYFGTSLSSPVIRPAADGTTAFKLQNAGGTLDYLTLDTTNSRISIGVSDTTGTLLVLDTKTSAGDPTGVDGAMYYNSSMARFRCYESGAWKNCTGANPTNGSTATQSVSAGSDTYLTASDLLLPTGGLQGPTSGATNGTKITWKVVMSKTAAGTAASTFTLRMGTAGTTGDASRCTFSTGNATADADGATVYITAYTTAGGASSTLNCSMSLTHQLPATGFADTPIVQTYSTATTADSTTSGTKMGLSFNAGTSSVITIQSVEVTSNNL